MRVKIKNIVPLLFIVLSIFALSSYQNNEQLNNKIVTATADQVTTKNIHVSLASDMDDDVWNYKDGVWTHKIYTKENQVRWDPVLGCEVSQFRFSLNIPQGATIYSAFIYPYEFSDTTWQQATIKRITEANVGPLEEDTKPPHVTNINFALHSWNGNEYEYKGTDITAMVQDQVNLPDWKEGNYFGVRYNLTQLDPMASYNSFQDYSHEFNDDSYMEVIFAENVGWLDGWNYRKPLLIHPNPNAGENYSIPINIYLGDGSDHSNVIFTNGYTQDDFGDIRFTTVDGQTLLVNKSVKIHEPETFKYYTFDAVDFTAYSSNYPAAYYFNQRTYLVFQGDLENGTDLDSHIIFYDHENSSWSGVYYVAHNYCPDKEEQDNHGSPALWVDNKGYIHVLYGAHAAPLRHVRSVNPEDITAWTNEIEVTLNHATYPSISYDPLTDIVRVYYRVTNNDDWKNVLRESTDNGLSWGPEWTVTFIPDAYSYTEISEFDPINQIYHLGWTSYNRTVPIENEDIYYAYLNFTDRNVYNITGHSLGTSINSLEEQNYCMVWDSNDRSVFGPNIHLDDDRIPYVFFATESGPSINFVYWNKANSSWTTPEEVSTPKYYGAGFDFIVHDSTNISAFLTLDDDIALFTWDGIKWDNMGKIINSEGGFLSFTLVPLNYDNEIKVVCTEYMWMKAEKRRAYAWGENGIVQRTISKHAEFLVEMDRDINENPQIIYLYYGIATSGSSTNTITSPPPESTSNPELSLGTAGSTNQTSIQTEIIYVKSNDSDFLWLSTIALNNVVLVGSYLVKKRKKKNPNLDELFQRDE